MKISTNIYQTDLQLHPCTIPPSHPLLLPPLLSDPHIFCMPHPSPQTKMCSRNLYQGCLSSQNSLCFISLCCCRRLRAVSTSEARGTLMKLPCTCSRRDDSCTYNNDKKHHQQNEHVTTYNDIFYT